MDWVEIRVEVQRRAEEFACDIVSDKTGRGIQVSSSEGERSVICGYLPADSFLDGHLSSLEARLALFDKNLDIPICHKIEVRYFEDEDWTESWKKHFQPERVTDRITICPSWYRAEYRPEPEEIVIDIDPGMAFGTGTHPTTVLSVQALQRYMNGGESIIDVGTGTGILTIAALRLGAEEVLAVDIDEKACRAAARNLRKNNLASRAVVKRQDLLTGLTPEREADIIVANILPGVITRMLSDAPTCLREGGLFVISGLLIKKLKDFKKNLCPTPFRCLEETSLGEWAALVLEKEA